LGFSFPTDLVSQAMPSVTTQFNPNPPAPRRMIISPDMERDHLYRSSSALYYFNLENNSKKWTIEVLKAKILNHRCMIPQLPTMVISQIVNNNKCYGICMIIIII
jgi:hypothetical protein